MATVKQCDKCGKVIQDSDPEVGQEAIPMTTNYIEIQAKFVRAGDDYCKQCQDRLLADAGMRFWGIYKQHRRPQEVKK